MSKMIVRTLALLLLLAACQTAPIPEGGPAANHRGYIEMCLRQPESVLCVRQ